MGAYTSGAIMSSNVVDQVRETLPASVGVRPLRSTHSHPAAYALIHPSSGQVYVGSTGDLYRRVGQHKTALRNSIHKNKNLQRAYDQDPRFDLTYKATSDIDEAIETEQHLIDRLMSSGRLMNRSPDARLANKGVALSDEAKENLRQRAIDQFSSEEAKAEHSRVMREKWQDPEYRAKYVGKPKSEQTKTAVSNGVRNRWKDPEYRKKMSDSMGTPVVINGVSYKSKADAARSIGMPITTLHSRIKAGTIKTD